MDKARALATEIAELRSQVNQVRERMTNFPVRIGSLAPSTTRKVTVKIGAATSEGTNKWSYAFEEVFKDLSKEGYATGTWTEMTGGLVNDSTFKAYNWYEIINGSSGQQGNGVNVGNLEAGFAIVPVAAGLIVEGTVHQLEASIRELWFSAPNAVDGSCA